jgi:hypothetical protein
LRELLEVPVPAALLRDKAGLRGLRLCDLDETSWEKFSEQECRELAAEVVRALGPAARVPMPIGSRRLPAIPDGVTLADLDVEVRTANCLVSVGIDQRPQDLHTMTIEGVLGLKGFWVKSLVDLLTSLEHAIDHPDARKPLRTDAGIPIKHLGAGHRYPRPGHRLAPQTLKEILLERVPARLVRGTPLRKARLCDLDETAWDHLPAEDISRLAGLIVLRAGSVAQNRTILRRPLPKPPRGMKLGDLHLENRTHNCLARQGFAARPQALGKLCVGDLMAIRAFGAKCLVDLLTSLETGAAREGKLDARLTEEARALGALPRVSEIPFTDPRLGDALRRLDTESSTVGEMVQRLVKRRLDPPDPVQVRRQILELRERIEQLARLPLEEELIQVFAPSANPRDRHIVAGYYGWDGKGAHTLDQLGKEHGLSRERIRQVCVRAVQRHRDARVFAPVLDRALELIDERVPCGAVKLEEALTEAGISTCGLSVESILRAAEFLARAPRFVLAEAGTTRLAVPAGQAELPRVIVQAAKRVATNFGAARISDVIAEIAERTSQKTEPDLVRETLQARDDFAWLDERQIWVRLSTLPRHGLPNVIDKVLSVAERIEVAKLRPAIARYRRTSRRLPPSRILLEFCRQMPRVRVEGSTIVGAPPRDWHKVLTGVERAMVEVLTKRGPVMERTALEEHCIRRGINRFSFNAMVMCSPVIEQHDRSIYGLVGRKVDRRAVKALQGRRSETPPSRVLKAFGRTKDGRSYLAYRLSKAAISGGVVTVPAAMKRQLRGKFILRTDEGHEVGTLVAKKGCGWGLGPALRGRHARQGDHLLLVLDTQRREARLQLGDESLLDRVRDE